MPINLGIVLVGFIILVFIAQFFINPLIVDIVAVGIAYTLFFFILEKRAIAVECPHCGGYIETNTPWKCGNPNCQKPNERVDDFPVVHRCQHCEVEPKAFECPHEKCHLPIYLSNDRLKTIYAQFIKPQKRSEPKPPPKDPNAEKKHKQQQEKSDLEHEVEMARLKAKLKEEQSKTAEPPLKKTAYEDLEEYFKSMMANEKAEREWRDIIDEQFKNDPVAREKAHRVVDQWMRNRPDM